MGRSNAKNMKFPKLTQRLETLKAFKQRFDVGRLEKRGHKYYILVESFEMANLLEFNLIQKGIEFSRNQIFFSFYNKEFLNV